MEPCKVYSKFMKMNNIGYECTVCSIKRRSRFMMYKHIKKAHQIDFKFPKKVNAGNSGRYHKCTKKIARKKSELKAKNEDVTETVVETLEVSERIAGGSDFSDKHV